LKTPVVFLESREVSPYQGVREGAIPSLRIGRRLVVPTAKLRDLLGEREAAMTGPRPNDSFSIAAGRCLICVRESG
jgi:hypothetical protein